MIILKLVDGRTGKEIETTQRRVDNWLKRNPGAYQKGDQIYTRHNKILYTITSRESKSRQKHNWLYKLNFWVHGTYEGDDISMGVKFKYHPTKVEIEKIIKRHYEKHCTDPEAVYKTMGNDWNLYDLATDKIVESK